MKNEDGQNNRNEHTQDTTKIFNRFIYSVWGVILFYTVLYYYIGAYFSSMSVAVGVFVFTPLTFILEKKGYHRIARIFFLFSCNFYIYATSLGFGHSFNIEYYSIPALMGALLINDFDDLKSIFICGSMPVITWILTNFLGTSIIPDHLLVIPPFKNVFISINFFGSFALSAIFLTILVRTIKEQRLKMIASAKMSSLGEMAGGIAHEINNPLGIIMGKTTMLRMKLSNDNFVKEKLVQDIIKIEDTTQRIAKIIKSLRSFSRNSEKDPMVKVLAQDLINETIELCRERFYNNNINLIINCTENLEITCRPTQISQVLMNLLGNAIDAVDNLPEKWVELSILTNAGQVEISITDSGTGIPDEVIDKMMQPFYTTKDIGKGTGLGLSISKGIIESYKGTLTYDRNSKNTKFIISMPMFIDSDPEDKASETKTI